MPQTEIRLFKVCCQLVCTQPRRQVYLYGNVVAVADLDELVDSQQPFPIDLRFSRILYAIRCASRQIGDFPWCHIASGE